MKSAKRMMAALLFFLASCVFCVFPQEPPKSTESAATSYELLITDRNSRIVAEIPLKDNRFDHVYVHSIHLTPVVERFKVMPDSAGKPLLHLFELVYESCGVGMPSDTENGFHLVDGKFILDMARDFAVIPLMVSTVEGHGVVANDHFYPFTDWVPQETLLFLTAKAVF
jgi:hypothetical protein